MIPLTFRSRFEPISDLFKQGVYNQCKSFSHKNHLLELFQHNNRTNGLSFSNIKIPLQDVYLLLRFSPRTDDEGGLNLQIATSYLLSENLQKLSIQQQSRTRITIFLSENFTTFMYSRLEKWFKSIYTPYTAITHIIRTKNGIHPSWKFMKNYIKNNKEIQLDTILFLLEDNYIFDTDMIFDTIEFFVSYNPCFVHPPDYSDSCRLDMSDDGGYVTIVGGRNRLWRSIFSTSRTYVCRLRTFLAFENLLMDQKNDFKSRGKIRALVGNAAFFCSIPSHGTHMEKLLLPDEVNVTADVDMEAYYKDWWSIARYALAKAQKKASFPASKLKKQNLFV